MPTNIRRFPLSADAEAERRAAEMLELPQYRGRPVDPNPLRPVGEALRRIMAGVAQGDEPALKD